LAERHERELLVVQQLVRDSQQQQQQAAAHFQQHHQAQLLVLQTQYQHAASAASSGLGGAAGLIGGAAAGLGSLAIGSGLLALVLQTLLPFVPYERVALLAQKLGQATSSFTRPAWLVLVVGDVLMRILERRAPLMVRIISRAVVGRDVSPTTLRLVRLVRLVLEAAVLLHLAIAIHDASRAAYQRLRAACQEHWSSAKQRIASTAKTVCTTMGGAQHVAVVVVARTDCHAGLCDEFQVALVAGPTAVVAAGYRYRQEVGRGFGQVARVVRRARRRISLPLDAMQVSSPL
jgi:hypothetical protein